MATLQKIFARVFVPLAAICALGCNDSQIVEPVHRDDLQGEWALVRSCGGCIIQCNYPEYFGQIVVSFQDGVYQKHTEGKLTEQGTYESRWSEESGETYYLLSRAGHNDSHAVYISTDGGLVIAGGWSEYSQYYELY